LVERELRYGDVGYGPAGGNQSGETLHERALVVVTGSDRGIGRAIAVRSPGWDACGGGREEM
jgi:hypothetical protein